MNEQCSKALHNLSFKFQIEKYFEEKDKYFRNKREQYSHMV